MPNIREWYEIRPAGVRLTMLLRTLFAEDNIQAASPLTPCWVQGTEEEIQTACNLYNEDLGPLDHLVTYSRVLDPHTKYAE